MPKAWNKLKDTKSKCKINSYTCKLYLHLLEALLEKILEISAALSAIACVWLAAKENIWNWPVAIISTLLYTYIFYQVKFYSDAVLQLVFLGFQVYGLWLWYQKNETKTMSKIAHLSLKGRILTGIVIAFICPIWYWILVEIKPDANLPLWDSIATVISLVAIVLQAKKKLETWILWILADVIYIPMYISKSLFFTAAIYLIFIPLAYFGMHKWLNKQKV